MKSCLFKGIIFLFISALFFSCTEKKTARQIFEENLEKNIEACVPIYIEKGADSIEARNFCRCIMETAFEIDSTFFMKDFEKHKSEMNDKINQHMVEFEKKCYPIIEKYLPEKDENIRL